MIKPSLVLFLYFLSLAAFPAKDLIFASNYLRSDSPLVTLKSDSETEFLYGLNIGSRYFQINNHHVDYFNEKNIIKTPSYILSRYKVDNNMLLPVGLSSHKMCTYKSNSISKMFSNNRVPTKQTIELMNIFSNQYNAFPNLRKNLWNKFFSCLAHIESLGPPAIKAAHGVADWELSHDIARQHLGAEYIKPRDVKFHIDHAQSVESKLNIGLYQFSPISTGNIRSCINQWNDYYTNYKIPLNETEEFYIKLLADPLQRFNSFCGVLKVVESFSVQINTSIRNNIFEENTGKTNNERCVSLHLDSGTSYNHFGPLQNSVPNIKSLGISNLNLLLQCSLNGM